MAKVFNRVRQSTATTGTGTITLGAAVAQHQTFATANAANGDVCSYAIEDGSAWEVGIGTYASAGPTLTRTLIGSSTGSLLNLSGAAQVFSTPLVHDIGPPIGQCVLTLSAGSLLLSPRNGNLLPINGRLWPVPAAGVSLSPPSDTVTMTIASPAVVTWTAHGLVAGSPVKFSTSGALPTGVTAGTTYYVISAGLTANTFQFSATRGGAAINTSGSQSGTHKIGTLRYIYAWMSGATMTLEASPTTHATDTATGVEIKSGDATRTLIGMAYDSSTAWVDSVTQRFVRSWFPYRGVDTGANFAYVPTTASTTFVELDLIIRNEVLLWAHETWFLTGSGSAINTGTSNTNTGVSIDGAQPADGASGGQPSGAGLALSSACVGRLTSGNEGYHYATVMAKVNAGTGSFGSATDAPSRYFALQGAVSK